MKPFFSFSFFKEEKEKDVRKSRGQYSSAKKNLVVLLFGFPKQAVIY